MFLVIPVLCEYDEMYGRCDVSHFPRRVSWRDK
jgi:hypothetical protein